MPRPTLPPKIRARPGELAIGGKRIRNSVVRRGGRIDFARDTSAYVEGLGWRYDSLDARHEVVTTIHTDAISDALVSTDPPAFGFTPTAFEVGVQRFRDVCVIVTAKTFCVFRGDRLPAANGGLPATAPTALPPPVAHVPTMYLASGKDNSDSICHNLVDVIPNVFLFRDVMGVAADDIAVVAPGNGHVAFTRDALCPGLRTLRPNSVYSVGELVIPAGSIGTLAAETHAHPAFKAHPETVAKLARAADAVPAGPGGGARVYFSRLDSERREMANEEALAAALAAEGFAVLRMGELAAVEQIRVAREAEVVVGPHGAALTNILFCQPRATVVAVMSGNKWTRAYAHLAHPLGLAFRPIIDSNEVVSGTWTLSPEGLRAAVRWATA